MDDAAINCMQWTRTDNAIRLVCSRTETKWIATGFALAMTR